MQSVEWIRYSGIAGAVGVEAWAVFCEFVSRDCLEHPLRPGEIKVNLKQLGKMTGLSPDQAAAAILKLKQRGYIRAFVPDNFIEECVILISSPLVTPTPLGEIQVVQNLGLATEWRYMRSEDDALERGQTGLADGEIASDPGFEWLLDRWMGAKAGAINDMILDQLRWISGRFSLDQIKRAWTDMEKLNWTSIYGLEKLLIGYREKAARVEEENKKKLKREKRSRDRHKSWL